MAVSVKEDARMQTEGGTLALDLCTHIPLEVLFGQLGQDEWVCLESVGVCAQTEFR